MSIELIGTIISLVAILITLAGVAVRLERRLNRLANEINRLYTGLNQIIRQSNGMLGLFGTLIGLLSKKEAIDKEDFGNILKDFTTIGHIREVSPNPLSRNETDTLNTYIRKARQGGVFTRLEVEEYNELVRKLEEERPDDPNIWPLVALAAFLLGLYLISREK
jgi:hypothetical protein